ncbi:hypothetical protein LZ30DRAFT_723723 [Colletotrichum cereale]|nr:hypothetical protein LZ30DRAFT_723723 [Colletotrichum cereale]
MMTVYAWWVRVHVGRGGVMFLSFSLSSSFSRYFIFPKYPGRRWVYVRMQKLDGDVGNETNHPMPDSNALGEGRGVYYVGGGRIRGSASNPDRYIRTTSTIKRG